MTEAQAFAARPAHIPEDKVFAFDIHRDPALLADPHERIRALVAEAPPFFWTPHNGGHWVALRHADVFAMFRDTELFSSAPFSPERRAMIQAAIPAGAPRMVELTPILMDPPEHTKFRAPLSKAFGPRTMMRLQADIEKLTRELIDQVADRGHCDFFAEVIEPLPVRVFLGMMGLPADRLVEFRELVREVFKPSTNPMEQGRRIRRIADAMMADILDRRDHPRDDLLSLLWSLELDGEPMTLELMEDYAALLFLAGLDTVINGMSFGMRHLAMHPALQGELRADPALIPEAGEELLRRYTFTVSQRRVTQDTQFAGQPLKAGEMVVLYLPAADLDPGEFDDPDRFEVRRAHKAHVAFGAGPHRCLGAHLARIELQTLYRTVLERLPEFRLDPARPVAFHAGMMLTISTLPIRWDDGAGSSDQSAG